MILSRLKAGRIPGGTQKAMAVLFEVDRTVITKHLKNIFQSDELQVDTVCAKIAHTAEDGKTYDAQYYSLDAIISVGYRINSMRAYSPAKRQNPLHDSRIFPIFAS